MKIIVYSTTTCPYCGMLKDYLNQKGLPFTERLLDQDEVAKNEMTALSGGFMGVPFLYVEKDNGTKETVVGFDKGKLETIFAA